MSTDSTTALLFFYGVFWATLLPAMSKFGPFETSSFFRKGERRVKGVPRFFLSLLCLNILPIAWLWFLLSSEFVIRHSSNPIDLVSAAIVSLSVFGFSSLVYALYGTKPSMNCFFTNDEIDKILSEPGMDSDNKFHFYFVSAVFYFVVPTAIASLISHSVGP